MKKIYKSLLSISLFLLSISALLISAHSLFVGASYDPSIYEPYFGNGTTGQYLRGDLTWQAMPSNPAMSFNNAASHSIVTTAAAANGFQLSSTRNTSVFYSVNVSTTATITGSSDGYVILEINSANTAVASDWKEVSRARQGQVLTLAITVGSQINHGSELMNIVPAGYYARLRLVTVNGTPAATFVSGQEAII